MWIFASRGFYSAVSYRPGKEKDLEALCGLSGNDLILLRGRSESHMRALVEHYGLEDFQYMYRPGHDYAWGGLIRREDFAEFMHEYVMEHLTATNFKNSIVDEPILDANGEPKRDSRGYIIEDDSYHDACSRVWSVMYGFQEKKQPKKQIKGQMTWWEDAEVH